MASNQSVRRRARSSSSFHGRLGRAAIAAIAIGFAADSVRAANYFWDPTQTASTNGGGGGTWDKTLPNFYTGAVDAPWVDGNTAVFGNAGGTVTLGVPISALNVQLTGTGYAIAPSATNTLTLTGGFGTNGAGATIYSNGAGTNTVGGPITIAATPNNSTAAYFTAATGSTLNLTGTITQTTAASGAETIYGLGTVNYSGAGFATGKFNVQGGATFNTSGTMSGFTGTYVGVSDTVAGTNWNVNSGSTINGTAATLFLANGINTSGAFTINGGTATFTTINVGAGFSGVNDGSGVLTVNGGVLTNAGTGATRLGSTRGGVGTLNLNGGTYATNGAFSVGASTSTNPLGGGSSVINFNGGTLQATGSGVSIAAALTTNVGNNGAIFDTNGGAIAVNSNLVPSAGSTGGVTKNGVGVLTLGGANTFAGNVAVNAGTLALTNASAVPNFGKVTVASGAYLSFGLPAFNATSIGAAVATANFQAGAGLGLDVATGTQTYADNLSGFTNFIKTGAGTLALTGNNSYTGSTTVAQGALTAPSLASFPGTGLILGNGGNIGTFAYTGGPTTDTAAVVLGGTTGGGTIDTSAATGNVTIAGNISSTVAGAKTFTIANTSTANTPTVSGTISNGTGTVALAKTGAGAAIIGNTNTYTGGTTVTAGTLLVTANNGLGNGPLAIPVAGTTSTATAGTLQLAGGVSVATTGVTLQSRSDPLTTTTSPQIENVSGDNTLTGNLNIAGGGGLGASIQSDAGTLTLTGNLTTAAGATFARPFIFTGAGGVVASGNVVNGTNTATAGNPATNTLSLLREGTGTLTLSGTGNTFTGGTIINGGTVALTNGATLGTGAVSSVNGTNAGAGTLAFAGTVNTTFANVITNGIAVAQTGASATTLTGANTYTGSTTVDNTAGTLSVRYSSTGTSAASPILTGPGGADIRNGAVVFNYAGDTTPVAAIRTALASGYANNFASGQLRSSTAVTNVRGLGYADDGTSLVTVRATLYGDATLDGSVTIADFNALAGDFNQTGGATWSGGDFNYDGNVTIADFNLLAGNFNQSIAGPALVGPNLAAWNALHAFAESQGDLAAFEAIVGVPEPTLLLAPAAVALISLRRRRA